jgi:hypothetical protein
MEALKKVKPLFRFLKAVFRTSFIDASSFKFPGALPSHPAGSGREVASCQDPPQGSGAD